MSIFRVKEMPDLFWGWYDYNISDAVVECAKKEYEEDFAGKMNNGSRLLDVACGSGAHAVNIAMKRPDLSIVGLDLSAGMIRRSRKRCLSSGVSDRVQFREGDAMSLPFEDDEFDYVCFAGAIKHMGGRVDQLCALGECLRVLRPGGGFLLYDVDRSCKDRAVDQFVQMVRLPKVFHGVFKMYFRTYIAGQSIDMIDARELLDELHLNNPKGPTRTAVGPALVISGTKPDRHSRNQKGRTSARRSDGPSSR